MDRVAVVSDIHGNRWALEAVLEDIAGRDVGGLLNLGDSLYGPLDPAGTAGILVGLDVTSIRGNEDRIILEAGDVESSPTLRFAREALDEGHRRWLASLEPTLVIDEFLLCHGTPSSDTDYLIREVHPDGVTDRAPEAIVAILGPVGQRVVLCGHDHVPGALKLPGGAFIVDPGSVGLQAYTDDEPFPHIMEAGSPHARYAVLEQCADGWTSEPVTVRYDWEAAAADAESNGRPDWAAWLRTGKAEL